MDEILWYLSMVLVTTKDGLCLEVQPLLGPVQILSDNLVVSVCDVHNGVCWLLLSSLHFVLN